MMLRCLPHPAPSPSLTPSSLPLDPSVFSSLGCECEKCCHRNSYASLFSKNAQGNRQKLSDLGNLPGDGLVQSAPAAASHP
jgi:hypothetical protein